MDFGLKGKQVLITGGSRGMGRACAKSFAAQGWNLHLVARGPAQLDAAKSEILGVQQVGVTLHAMAAPVHEKGNLNRSHRDRNDVSPIKRHPE